MVLAADDSAAMYVACAGYVLGFIGAPLLARHKNLSPIMYAAGILGLIGLIGVAVVSARCKDCKQPVSSDELKRRYCPRCQGASSGDRKAV